MTVVPAAIAGDTVGHSVGHHFGPKILTTRPLRRHEQRSEKAQDFIRRRGPEAGLPAPLHRLLRSMMPALAGISLMDYRRFLLFNALGGLVWGVGFTLLGYFAGSAYQRVEAVVGRVVAIAVAVIVVVGGLFVWRVRRRRQADSPDPKNRAG
ncbi:DedA family protein [Streptomyces sp. NPDC058297]|uniref:DedA family protein n=1 Tax=Streptomyces sp. NPDC058297 TaxID=3346433 RepID=UPI0036E42EFB